MTRTERASYPRAVIRDRSVSRTGLNNHIRKGGAGRHNWGGIQDEPQLELEALSDEERELVEEGEGSIPNGDARSNVDKNKDNKKPILSKSTSSLSAEELQQAKTIRKNALKKKDIDLATIARTSSAVSSPPPASVTDIVTPTSV